MMGFMEVLDNKDGVLNWIFQQEGPPCRPTCHVVPQLPGFESDRALPGDPQKYCGKARAENRPDAISADAQSIDPAPIKSFIDPVIFSLAHKTGETHTEFRFANHQADIETLRVDIHSSRGSPHFAVSSPSEQFDERSRTVRCSGERGIHGDFRKMLGLPPPGKMPQV
jgi:hypothetical protein